MILKLILFSVIYVPQSVSLEPVQVLIPFGVTSNIEKFWMLDKKTKEASGFYIDLIDELFKSINISYSLVFNTPSNYKNYNDLGR